MMKMTEDDIAEASGLIRSHNELRAMIAKTDHRDLTIYAPDCDFDGQARLPAGIANQIKLVALGLVAARLRELGVEPKASLTHTCFTCNGSGETPIKGGS